MSEQVLIDFYIHPGARKSAVVGYHGERIKIKLQALAEENKANKELIEFLAEKLDLPKKNISLVYGQTNKMKTVGISGIGRGDIIKRLTHP